MSSPKKIPKLSVVSSSPVSSTPLSSSPVSSSSAAKKTIGEISKDASTKNGIEVNVIWYYFRDPCKRNIDAVGQKIKLRLVHLGASYGRPIEVIEFGGGPHPNETGVTRRPTLVSDEYLYGDKIFIGYTTKSVEEIESIIDRLKSKFLQRDYNCASYNCHVFVDTFVKELGLGDQRHKYMDFMRVTEINRKFLGGVQPLVRVSTAISGSVSSPQGYSHIFKILVVGDSAVGKTCLLSRYTENNFSPNHVPTAAVDFKPQIIEVDGERVKLEIWDTAGREGFHILASEKHQGTDGVIVVYDIANIESFSNVNGWFREIDQTFGHIPRILVGNKCDVDQSQMVALSDAKQFSEQLDISHFETSALNNSGIGEIFNAIARMVLSEKKSHQTGLQTGGKKV